MEQVQHAIYQHRDWFYLITILLTFLEGETFVLLAGSACAAGLLDPLKLGACAWVGSFLADQWWFFVGRSFGPMVLRRWPRLRHGIEIVHRWLERWDTVFILTFRFMYGIRNVSAIALGLSDVPAAHFFVLNFIAAGIWVVAFVGAGMLFGRTLGAVLGDWAISIEIGIAAVFLVVVMTMAAIARCRALRARRTALLSPEGP